MADANSAGPERRPQIHVPLRLVWRIFQAPGARSEPDLAEEDDSTIPPPDLPDQPGNHMAVLDPQTEGGTGGVSVGFQPARRGSGVPRLIRRYRGLLGWTAK